MARKDIGLLTETAGASSLALLPALGAAMDALVASGHGQDNYTIVSA